MKYLKYFSAKRRGFIKSESNLAPKGASHFKNENIRCDTTAKYFPQCFLFKHKPLKNILTSQFN